MFVLGRYYINCVSVCATTSFECHVCFSRPFVPFQSSIMNHLLSVRLSQKLVYENSPVQTKIINGRSRMKFYLKHHCGGGKASAGFDLDLIRTGVSMAISSHSQSYSGKNGFILF